MLLRGLGVGEQFLSQTIRKEWLPEKIVWSMGVEQSPGDQNRIHRARVSLSLG